MISHCSHSKINMGNLKRISKLRFPARSYQLKEIRCVVVAGLQQLGCEGQESDAVVLAINEACMNIIQHGYGESQSGEIILEIFEDDNNILFRITDYAKTVDEKEIKSRPLDEIRPGGLGMHIIHEVMDSVKFLKPERGTGNVLELRKTIQTCVTQK